MLCPECESSAPGGTPCPNCGEVVPERESFDGQGGLYLWSLLALSLALLAFWLLFTSIGPGPLASLRHMRATGWIWLFVLVLIIPVAIGVYYWLMLRQEEVWVTDEGISRRSHWGDVSLRWSEITAFRKRPVSLRETRLGRLALLSRYFARASWLDWPPASYELEAPPDEAGTPRSMVLEPGTIDDLPWLMRLIEEHLGPALAD